MSGTLPSVPDQTLHSTLRGRLEAEVERLRGQIELLEPGGTLSYDEGFADSGQVAAEQGENKALVNQFRKELEETQRALDKFDEDAYGLCERCGQPIAEARLEAMPATRYCIEHA
jgi:RNA polymerase-binding transcription factor DksA